VPRWRDIRTLTGESFYDRTGLRTVDVISGGFPCQPFSVAGKRRGKEDDRYLWPEMLRVIQELRPAWVVGENVAGIVSMALDTALSDLEGVGYTAQAFIIPACAVDAPHRRDRCAIVAYADGAGQQRRKQFGTPYEGGQSEPHRSACKCSENVGNSASTGFQNWTSVQMGQSSQKPEPKRSGGDVSNTDDQREIVRRHGELSAVEESEGGRSYIGGGVPEYGSRERRAAQSSVGRSHDGLSSWMDGVRTGWFDGTWEEGIPRIAAGVPDRVNRLKCLGNAVVPEQFYPIFRAIAEIERNKGQQ